MRNVTFSQSVRVLIFSVAIALLLSGNVESVEHIDGDIATSLAAHLDSSENRMAEKGLTVNVKYTKEESDTGLCANGRLRGNAIYLHDNPYSAEARNAYALDADWRELYLSFSLNEWHVIAGYQQVVWGKADGLRILDQVNPVDLRDFIMPDLSDYRKAVPILRANRVVAGWAMEAIYLPFFVPTSFAAKGSEFYIPLLDEATASAVMLLPEEKPAKTLRNGEVGLELSRSIGQFDLSVMGFYTRDDNPVFKSLLVTDATGGDVPALQLEYHRMFLMGIGLAVPTGNSTVVRAELSYVPNGVYMIRDNAGGLTKTATTTAMVGLDYTYRDWMFAAQTMERFIDDWDERYVAPHHSPIVTLSAQGTHLGAKLETRFSLFLMPLHEDGSMIQLKFVYKPYDHWSYGLSVDMFDGGKNGLVGQFAQKDRVKAEIKYIF